MSTAYDTPGSIESALRDAITPIEEIIADAAQGKMYILVDHEDRENEGDLIIPLNSPLPMRSISWPHMVAG